MPMSKYKANQKCPKCKTKKEVRRDYEADQITSQYVRGLHEMKTIGEYAEKQSKIYGPEKCKRMAEGFKTKRPPKET